MKLVPITEAQASFLQIEIVERFEDDPLDKDQAEVAQIVGDALRKSRGKAMAVPNKLLASMILEVINAIDDTIEEAKKAKSSRRRQTAEDQERGVIEALSPIGGVTTIAEAQALHKVGSALYRKTIEASYR